MDPELCPMCGVEGENANDPEDQWKLVCPECGGIFGSPPILADHEPNELGL